MKNLKLLVFLINFEAVLAILWTVLSPADSQTLVFLSFSRTKIILLTILLAAWLVLLSLAYYWHPQERLEKILPWLDNYCLEQERLASLLILSLAVPLVLLAVVLRINSIPPIGNTFETWAPVTFPVLFALAHRFLPLWLWLSISSVEFSLFLGARYWSDLRRPGTWAWKNTGTTLVVLLVACVTLFHWAVLAFQLRFFVNNPAWYWSFDPQPFTTLDIIFVLGILVILAVLFWSLGSQPKNYLPSLIIIFFLGWFLQNGIGYIGGDGFTSLRDRYFSTYHQVYPLFASENNSGILDTIRNYETRYGDRLFTNTKPPGLLVFYTGMERLINGNNSGFTSQQRYVRLSLALTFIFPVIAMLNVFLIFVLAKKLLGSSSSSVPLVSAFLYVLCPNIILFSLYADQAIYPLLFLLGAAFIVFVTCKHSFLWACLLGILLYLAIFFAFTMLPLYVFTAIYFLLDYWTGRKDRNLSSLFKIGFGFALGNVLLYLVFLFFLNYNFFPRFQEAVQINHNFDFYTRIGQRIPSQPESFGIKLQQVAGAAWLNNLDFAAAIGFPIYLLAILQAARAIFRAFTGRASRSDIVLTGLFTSFIILNLAGTAQGEVPRLWMFWVPVFVVLASLSLKDLFKKKFPAAVAILALSQVITILLTYHFQDFRM